MRPSVKLLKIVGKAVLNAVGAGVLGEVVVEVLPDVAAEAMRWWSREADEEQRRAELQELVQASASAVGEVVQEVVQEIAGDKPPEVREALAGYLQQMPAAIRQTLRRPSDASGATVPRSLTVRGAEDLLALLPTRVPRFKAGDRPLPGVDWELSELLGVGGFGEVWKARNPHFPGVAPVALKFCLDEAAKDRLLRHEAAVLDRVMRQGKHPGIVQLQHTYLSANPPCLEYEFVAGGDLAGLIQEWHQSKGGPKPQQAAQVVLALARIVGFAHQLPQPIVHRDLKPANILVQRDSAGRFGFKIADFGIGGLVASRSIEKTRVAGTTRGELLTTSVRGAYTPLYASPQQMRGGPPDVRDDVHALGVIWYQLLTGDLASGVPGGLQWSKQLQHRGVPERQVQILASCFEARAEDRPAHAGVLAQRLEEGLHEPDLVDVVPVEAPRPPAKAPSKVPPKLPRKEKEAEAEERKPGGRAASPHLLWLAIGGGVAALLLAGCLGIAGLVAYSRLSRPTTGKPAPQFNKDKDKSRPILK
jgi:serine/threonine protein kinase